jgi:aryl-alcohol dehydrogenase-like predicted oxidoreductase
LNPTPQHLKASTIIGATTMAQLKENIDAFEPTVVLSEETLSAVDKVHEACRDPAITSFTW